MKFFCFFALFPLFLLTTVAQVPVSEVGFKLKVDEWWAEHPLNPEAEDYKAGITSPEKQISAADHDRSIQKCIDSLPKEGGTIILSTGDYEGGFRIVNRKNVHIIGEGDVTISGGENYIIGSEKNLQYGDFCEAVHKKVPEAMLVAAELPTQNIYIKNITFDDSPVRLASCRGVLLDKCVFTKAENRDAGDKDEEGKKVLRWYRPLPVTGIMGLQEIWMRNCDFSGHFANGCYLDGAQFSGFIDCKFAGVDRLWHNAVILFTNDDLSLDADGNKQLDLWERRDTRYFVFEGCEFGHGYKRGAVAVSGRDVLVKNCVVNGPLESLMVVNAKTSGKPIEYESFGVKALHNTLNKVKYIITAEGAANKPEKGVPDWWAWTKYDIGHFEIRDNRITGMKEALHEIPRDSKILSPHQIADNGPEAAGAKIK